MQSEIRYLSCYTGVIEHNKLYTVNMFLGVLLEYDLEDFSYQTLARIPIRDKMQLARVNKMFKLDNVFYCTFENTRTIWMFDMLSKEPGIIESEGDTVEGYLVNASAFVWKDHIYLMPGINFKTVGVFNWRTHKFEREIQMDRIPYASGKIRINIGIRDGKIWYTVLGAFVLTEIDIETREEKHWAIGIKNNILAVSLYEEYFWIILSGAELIKWNPEEGIIGKYDLGCLDINEEKPVFRYVYETDSFVYIVPCHVSCIWKINKFTEEVFSIKYPDELRRVHPNLGRSLFFSVLKDGDRLFFLPFAVNVLVQFGLKDENITCHECSLSAQEIWEYYTQNMLGINALQENEILNLSFYLEKIKMMDMQNCKER